MVNTTFAAVKTVVLPPHYSCHYDHLEIDKMNMNKLDSH